MAEQTSESADFWGELDGQSIYFPVVVDDMNQLTLTYSVPLAAAQALLPGDGFDIVETEPGKAMFVISIVDYVVNPWGDYNEVNLGFIVNSRKDPEVSGAFVYRMPVNEEFTCKAGNQVMGLPKTVEDLTFEYGETVTVNLAMSGQPTLKVTFPDEAPVMEASMTETLTFSYLGGGPTAIPLEIEIGGAVIDPESIVVELGDSEVADELRTLGLPDNVADMALWGKGLKGTFQRPYSIG